MGIISKGSSWKDICGSTRNGFRTTISATVPGKVLDWVKSFEHPEIKKCLLPKNKKERKSGQKLPCLKCISK